MAPYTGIKLTQKAYEANDQPVAVVSSNVKLIPVVLAALLVGCAAQSMSTTTTPTTTSTLPVATTATTATLRTTTTLQSSFQMSLFRVDPATLAPLPEAEPLAVGDWISGELSQNGKWLALNVWTEPDSESFLVMESSTGEIVTEKPGSLGNLVGFGEDGSVYSMSHLIHSGARFRQLAPGATSLETLFDAFRPEFSLSRQVLLLDRHRAAWLGSSQGDLEEQVAAVVVANLQTSETAQYLLPDVAFGSVSDVMVEDWTLSEFVTPTMVWGSSQDRILVVHGNEEKVTTLDLTSGETATHQWSESTSWLDDLFAWLIPPAHAKGPSSYGMSRTATLSPSGDVLYVGTSVAEVIDPDDAEWNIESTPRGVHAISTSTWEILHHWDIPASEVSLSPDGKYLVATGLSWWDSLSTSDVTSQDAFVIDAESHEILAQFVPPGAWPGTGHDVQFSPDGRYLYLARCCEDGPIHIIDLDSVEVVGRAHGTLFGEALLLATRRP